MKLLSGGGVSSQSSLPNVWSHTAGSFSKPSTENLTQIQRLFGGRKQFWRAVAFYLKKITNGRCRFQLKEFTGDFIVLEILEPCHYFKGVKISNLLNFFDLPSERSEDLRSVVKLSGATCLSEGGLSD